MADAPTLYAIDLGTSNSLLAAVNLDRVFDPVPLDPAEPDPTILRSILCFPDAGGAFVGSEALRQFIEYGGEARLLRSIKHCSASGRALWSARTCSPSAEWPWRVMRSTPLSCGRR